MMTELVNATTQDIRVREKVYSVTYRELKTIRPSERYFIPVDPNATYRDDYLIVQRILEDRSHWFDSLNLSSGDLYDAAEITFYETIENTVAWRISKARGSSQRRSATTQDEKAFFDLRTDVYSKIKVIQTKSKEVREALKQVKVCPAQCNNLAQTCLDGTEKFESKFNALIKNMEQLWDLYYSRRLPHLIGSLGRLLSTLESCKDLLEACGSEWVKMALVLSIPPSAEKGLSKFDILINELSWNLDTIDYALHVTGGMEFKWNDSSLRYIFVEKLVPASSEPVVIQQQPTKDEIRLPRETGLSGKSEELVRKDREHLLLNLQKKSLLTQKNNALDPSQVGNASWGDCISSVLISLTLQKKSLLTQENFALDLSQVGNASWGDCISSVLMERLKFELEEILEVEEYDIANCYRMDPGDLTLSERIFSSNSKSIYKGSWCGETVAISVAITTGEHFRPEAARLLKLQHPNIVDFFGWSFTEEGPPRFRDVPIADKFVSEFKYLETGCLVMEWMPDGDLSKAIESHFAATGKPFDLVVGVDVLQQIAGAMAHIHDHGLMHRDLKAANCLVQRRPSSESNSLEFYTVKLIDFETCKEDDPDAPMTNHTVKRGTTAWMAPEIIGDPNMPRAGAAPVPYTGKADVYSFGMVCYEVITGETPFRSKADRGNYKRNKDVWKAVKEGERPSLPGTLPKRVEKLVRECWAQEPGARPSFTGIRKELWTIKKEFTEEYVG